MPLLPTHSTACYQVIAVLTSHRENRRNLSSQFTELPDRDAWPDYYRVIPEPRSLDGIRESLDKGRYNSTDEVWNDLKLVFLNAMHFNEPETVIWRNAKTLETLLTKTWNNTSMLPRPPPSPTTPPYTISPARPPPPPPPSGRGRRKRSPPPDDGSSPPPHDNKDKQALLAQSEEIVRKVEAAMERYQGYDAAGWMVEVKDGDPHAKYAEIVKTIKEYEDEAGIRLAASLERVPEESTIPYLSFNTPLSLGIVEARSREKGYASAMDFDMDLTRLFEKCRRYFETGSSSYGDVILLQRMYHQLTSPDPAPSSNGTKFASVAAGPGNAKPLRSAESTNEDGVTSFRISSKERQFTESAVFKGQTYRVGDYVHCMNPDDPTKPIIAQVFKTFLPDGASAEQNQYSLTVCWYYRPEQTVHPAHRQFFVNEVFKTSHFADHAIGDVIEKIGCQFLTKFTRGRPKPPYWYPGWPLYVCDSRYNDKEKSFVRIKNWNSCIPDDLRKMDFMPVQPFERTIQVRKVGSPFLSGGKGPGKIGEPEAVQLREEEGEREREREAKRRRIEDGPGGATGRPQPPVESTTWIVGGPTAAQRRAGEDRSVVTAAGGATALQANGSIVEPLPAETVKLFVREGESEVLWFSGPPLLMARLQPLTHSLAYLHFRATGKRPAKNAVIDRAVEMAKEEAEGGERAMVQ